jgi:hypothetical protein
MITSIITLERAPGKRGPKKREVHFICDFCGNSFVRDYGKWAIDENRVHTCSYKCSNSHPHKLEKERLSNLEKYGVEYPSQAQKVKDKQARTCIEKYGVSSCWRRADVIEKAQCESAKMKRHQSLLRNGTFGRSKLEADLADMLSVSVKTACNVWLQPKFSIDMSIDDGETLIQFDGVHWHGMDLKLDSPNTRHFAIIRSKVVTDNELETFVMQHNRRLIRITDKFFTCDRARACDLIHALVQDKTWVGVKRLGKHFNNIEKEAHYVEHQ